MLLKLFAKLFGNDDAEIRQRPQIEAPSMSTETEAFKESEVSVRMNTILGTLQDSVLVVSFVGRIVDSNDATEDVFKYASDELRNQNIALLLKGNFNINVLSNEARTFWEAVSPKLCKTPSDFRAFYNDYMKKALHSFFGRVKTYKGLQKDGVPLDLEVKVTILNPEAERYEDYLFLFVINDITDEVRSLSKIDELTQLQLAILSSVPNPIFYKDENFVLLGANREFQKLFQVDDVEGKLFQDFMQQDIAYEIAKIEQALSLSVKGDVSIKQFKLSVGGANKILVLSCTGLWDFRLRFKGIVGAFIDVTQLLTVERFKDVLLDSIPNPVYHLDKNFAYRSYNEGYSNMLGLDISLIGLKRTEAMSRLCSKHPQYSSLVEYWEEKDNEFLEQNLKEQTYETRIFDVSKREFRDCILYRTIVQDAAGNFDGILSVITDITEIKKVQALKQNLFEAMPNPVYYKDRNFRYQGMNSVYPDSIGVPRSSIIGKTRAELFALLRNQPIPQQGIEHINEIEEKLSRKDVELLSDPSKPVQVFEEEGWSSLHQAFRKIVFYRRAIYDANGNFDGVVCSLLDITELKDAINEIKSRKAELELLLDAIPDIVMFEDKDDTVLMSNRSADMFKNDVVAPLFFEAQKDVKRRLIISQSLRQTVEVRDPKFGTIHVFDMVVSKVDGSGKTITVARDVSHLMNHVAQATALASALNNVEEVVVIINTMRKFVFANLAFYHQYGIEPSDLIDVDIDGTLGELPAFDTIGESWDGFITVRTQKFTHRIHATMTPIMRKEKSDYFTIVIELDKL